MLTKDTLANAKKAKLHEQRDKLAKRIAKLEAGIGVDESSEDESLFGDNNDSPAKLNFETNTAMQDDLTSYLGGIPILTDDPHPTNTTLSTIDGANIVGNAEDQEEDRTVTKLAQMTINGKQSKQINTR